MNYVLVEHEHHSSRFDRSMQLLADYIKAAQRRTNIITLTEVGNNFRDNALRINKNWGVAQVEGPFGNSECAIVYDRRVYEQVRDEHTLLLGHTKGIGGEDYIQMPVSTFDTDNGRLRVGVYHGPARIEWPFGFRKSEPLEVKAHKEVMDNLIKAMKRWNKNPHLDGWMIPGDLNLNVRKLWVKTYLKKELPPRVKYNWDGHLPPRGRGTHGGRIIDLTFYGKMKMIQTGLSPDDESSDHRPYHDSYLL